MLQNLEDTLEIHKNAIGKNTQKSEKKTLKITPAKFRKLSRKFGKILPKTPVLGGKITFLSLIL